jgi:hypothetical protein
VFVARCPPGVAVGPGARRGAEGGERPQVDGASQATVAHVTGEDGLLGARGAGDGRRAGRALARLGAGRSGSARRQARRCTSKFEQSSSARWPIWVTILASTRPHLSLAPSAPRARAPRRGFVRSAWVRCLLVWVERADSPGAGSHTPWSRASFAGASVLSVEGGAVWIRHKCGGIGAVKNRFGPQESGRRFVAYDGRGDLSDGGFRERIDGGDR